MNESSDITGTPAVSGSKLGMWLFLLTEILLFGALFLLYAVYRFRSPGDFGTASLELDRTLGTLNTAVLLTSSLFVALSTAAYGRKNVKRTAVFLTLATILGTAFLGIKAIEWIEKFRHGIFPNSPELLERPAGEVMYFGLYFVMTGLHALHVVAGLGTLGFAAALLMKKSLSPVLLDNAGLYWHLVDVIWIFLFPLFYLVR